MSHATVRITAELDLDRVLQEIVDSAREVIGARYTALGVLGADGKLETFVVSGLSDDERARIGDPPQGRGVLGILTRDPRPLRLHNIADHPDAAGFPENHPVMETFLGVPVIGRDGPIGNLYLTEKAGGTAFTEDDESFAVLLAAHAAVAVQNARFSRERERLLNELRAMQISRDRFFSMINHELRNALTAVYGWADLWIRRTRGEAPRAAKEVHESAERMLVLLDDLLDLSRLDADKLQPIVRAVDAWTIVRESVSTVEPAAERKGVPIAIAGPPGPVDCSTDPQRVRQVLINLLTNAVRHSPSGAQIQVVLDAADHKLRFEVIDHGDGIPAELQLVIFEAFERAGVQTDRGTGLGLALSRKLSRILGGDLTVESTAGQGCRFVLQIPRYASGE